MNAEAMPPKKAIVSSATLTTSMQLLSNHELVSAAATAKTDVTNAKSATHARR
jgi:hypothetical protein